MFKARHVKPGPGVDETVERRRGRDLRGGFSVVT